MWTVAWFAPSSSSWTWSCLAPQKYLIPPTVCQSMLSFCFDTHAHTHTHTHTHTHMYTHTRTHTVKRDKTHTNTFTSISLCTSNLNPVNSSGQLELALCGSEEWKDYIKLNYFSFFIYLFVDIWSSHIHTHTSVAIHAKTGTVNTTLFPKKFRRCT